MDKSCAEVIVIDDDDNGNGPEETLFPDDHQVIPNAFIEPNGNWMEDSESRDVEFPAMLFNDVVESHTVQRNDSGILNSETEPNVAVDLMTQATGNWMDNSEERNAAETPFFTMIPNAVVEPRTQTNANGMVNSELRNVETTFLTMVPNAAVELTTHTHNKGVVNSDVENVEATPPAKRRRSEVWDCFYELKDANGNRCGAKCKACGKKYKTTTKNGTSPLREHIKKCPKKRNSDREEHSEVTNITNPAVSPEKSPSDQELGCIEMARMIAGHRYRRSSLDNEDLLENLKNNSQPYLQLQLNGSLRGVVLDIYKEEKERLRGTFNAQSSGRYNLSINLLRRGTVAMYCCLTLQFIDEGWKLKKKVLAFRRVRFSSNCSELYGTFISMLLDWSHVHKNVGFITSENTEEADNTVSKTKCWLIEQNSLPSGGKWSNVNCFLHFLNLLIEVGFREAHDIICKIANCLSYVRDTPAEYYGDDLRSAVECVRSQVKNATSEDMVVSWTVNLQMFEGMLGLKDAFKLVEVFDSEFKNLNPEVEEWDKATLIYQILIEMDDAIRSLTESKFLTANVYFPKVCCIYWSLFQFGGNVNLGVQSMASKMKVKFDKYWNNSILGLAIAVILDPRFKFNIVERWMMEIFGNDANMHITTIRNFLEEVYNEYADGFNNSACTSSPSLSGGHFDLLNDLGIPFTSSNNAEDKSELERYLEEPKFRSIKDFDILAWWHVNTPNFPTLAKIARDFLAIPMSSTLSNPSFNDDIKKIDAASTDLDPEIIEALICTKDWLSTA